MKQFILLVFIAFIATASFAQHRYGTLDSTFGIDGKVVSNGFGVCYAVAVQGDEKIVAAGLGVLGEDSGFVVARYLPNGILDNSFGIEGRIVTEFKDMPNPYLTSVALLPDKRIVVSGFVQRRIGYGDDAVLVCYLPNGTPDSSFGTNGATFLHIYDKKYDNNTFKDIAVQPDGRIVAAGKTTDNADFENSVFYNLIARYNVNGTLDESFGNGGTVVSLQDSFTHADDIVL